MQTVQRTPALAACAGRLRVARRRLKGTRPPLHSGSEGSATVLRRATLPRVPRATRNSGASVHEYALEFLYRDQDRRWVKHCVAPTIAWLKRASARQPCTFKLDHRAARIAKLHTVELVLRWDLDELARHDPGVREDVALFGKGATPHRERTAELAGYGLALVAISVLMPGRRVVAMPQYTPPDLLLDDTPDALRGVEVAARTSGGSAALRAVRETHAGSVGKRQQLLAMKDLVEAHLSLWCASPRVAEMLAVKP
jgi:hypothetical protein